ncbi:hypothetical protein T492DRAFT_1071927 [Pavlovales sp. CCMP2436]|nr:hypothetical protein T492DRAFT_1071927 [Pavlovales sp. CCMP2436]
MLGLEVTLEEMEPSDGLSVDDVLYEMGLAFMATQREPDLRLGQIYNLVAGKATFVTTNNIRAVVEDAQISIARPSARGVVEAAAAPPTEAELEQIADTMAFNPKLGVYHVTQREFEQFLCQDGPSTLRLREEFDSRPHESYGEFAKRAAIGRPLQHGGRAL